MLTRLLLAFGLMLIAVSLAGRVWLTFVVPPRGDVRFTLRGEDLLAGLEAALTMTPRPQPAASPVATATPIPSGVYRVRPGDTLSSIALRFGVSVYALAQANGLSVTTQLYLNQLLRLPDEVQFPVAATPGADGFAQPSTPTPTAPAPPPSARVPVPLPTEIIRIEWPRQMAVDRSDVIRLSLGRSLDQVIRSSMPVTGTGALTVTLVATPLVIRMDRALSAEYEGAASGRLAAAAFDLHPLRTDTQPLTTETLAWAWSIFPKRPGRYLALASIEIQWTPRAGGPSIYHALWQYAMEIEVVQTWVTLGQLNLIGFLGSSLLVGALLEGLRQWLARRRRPLTKIF